MKPTFVHCFFEQSGTFKNAFEQLGIDALDYDIENSFGQTDVVCDLFRHIQLCFDGDASIFDNINSDELIFAFFPCIYFNECNEMYFCGTSRNLRGLTPAGKIAAILERSKMRSYYYDMLLKLFLICEERNLPLIVENPYNAHHFLRFNFPYKPSIIDMNRTLRGDYFKKPTQYFFLNISPGKGQSLQKIRKMEYILNQKRSQVAGKCSIHRSLIAPEYAHNFICDFILSIKSGHNVPTLFDS